MRKLELINNSRQKQTKNRLIFSQIEISRIDSYLKFKNFMLKFEKTLISKSRYQSNKQLKKR